MLFSFPLVRHFAVPAALAGTAVVLTAVLATPSQAQTTAVSTVGEFSSALYTGTPTTYNVGTFSFFIPGGETIVSATLTGKTGNSVVNSTAPFDLFLDGILVKQVTAASPDYFIGQAFTFNFTPGQLSVLTDGTANLTVTHTGNFNVRLGETKLTVNSVPNAPVVPEGNATLLLAMGGLPLLGLAIRNRRKNAAKA